MFLVVGVIGLLGIGYNVYHWFDGLTQNRIGYLYSNGVIFNKNELEALRWFERSASKGNAKGITNLGVCYFCGVGVGIDHEKAFNMFYSAAQKNYDQAAFDLAACYVNGLGTGKNRAEAIKWFTKAAGQGLKKAEKALAEIQIQNSIKHEDYSPELIKRAEAGDVKAQNSLAHCYLCGQHGIAQDTSKGFKWAQESALKGDSGGQYSLGCAYADGRGVEKDEKEALKWWNKAADPVPYGKEV